ncbi:hypothetical protein [Streptomyces sp. NPDC005283]|uniref:hypothetical protein n=1 Tax=Streptomyces sp. NPDC005283 TaxID=3156871 RepID=UPI00345193A3
MRVEVGTPTDFGRADFGRTLVLLNTRWAQHGARQDPLTGVDGLPTRLTADGLAKPFTADSATLKRTWTPGTRSPPSSTTPDDPTAAARADEVLGHGRIRARPTADGPGEEEFADPAPCPGRTAAHGHLDPLRTRAGPDPRLCA